MGHPATGVTPSSLSSLLACGNQVLAQCQAQAEVFHGKHESTLALSISIVFNGIQHVFNISLNLHFTNVDVVEVFYNLQSNLGNVASRDPAGMKGNIPVPISQMRKLTSREAKAELAGDEESTQSTCGSLTRVGDLGRALLS